MKKQIKAVSNQQLKRIKSVGVRAGSRAVRSGKRLIRPLDGLLRKSRVARLIFITGFVVGSLILTSLLGYQVSRMIWTEDATVGEQPSDILPIELDTQADDFGEFLAGNNQSGQLSDLKLVDRNSEAVQLSPIGKRVLIVNFWATWCVPCVKELPKIEQLATVWKNRGVEIVAVSVDQEGWERVEPFLETHRLKRLKVLVDADQPGMNLFNLRGLPTTVFINDKGQEFGRIAGEYDWHSTTAMNLLQRLSQ
ncbi:MAG: TlpA disulfide reductase family protein [Alphaproteobacteria bacterium]|nr:TlpA disulfide reductase family protein [Alphaproteobacteria bacterium]